MKYPSNVKFVNEGFLCYWLDLKLETMFVWTVKMLNVVFESILMQIDIYYIKYPLWGVEYLNL